MKIYNIYNKYTLFKIRFFRQVIIEENKQMYFFKYIYLLVVRKFNFT